MKEGGKGDGKGGGKGGAGTGEKGCILWQCACVFDPVSEERSRRGNPTVKSVHTQLVRNARPHSYLDSLCQCLSPEQDPDTWKVKKINAVYFHMGGGDSSVVRAPDSWLKGRGFESLLERRENFLLQGRLSVLTLISVSVPPPCYRSST